MSGDTTTKCICQQPLPPGKTTFVCGAKIEPQYRQRTDVCAMCRQGFTLCRCRHQLREWKEKQAMRDKLEDAFARLRVAFEADDYTPMEDVIEAVLQRFTGDLHLVSENSRLRAENERLRECNDAMREPMRKLREALDMPAQGEGYVIDFAIRDLARLNTHVADLHRRFNTLGEERDEALRLLATRVEAKRLDEAQEEVAALREACALALNVMEQKNRVNVPPFAKFITVEFAPEDIAVLRAALEKKP